MRLIGSLYIHRLWHRSTPALFDTHRLRGVALIGTGRNKKRQTLLPFDARTGNALSLGILLFHIADDGLPTVVYMDVLNADRSIAVDNSLHVYGTPFFIQTGLPLANEKQPASFDRLVIAQDTGSAIVGPARADIYWGAGDQAGHIAGHLRHPGKFAMLVPRELDPVAAGERMPLPPQKPPPAAKANVRTLSPNTSHPVYPRWYRPKRPTPAWVPVRSR